MSETTKMTLSEFGDDIYEFVYNSNLPPKKITRLKKNSEIETKRTRGGGGG